MTTPDLAGLCERLREHERRYRRSALLASNRAHRDPNQKSQVGLFTRRADDLSEAAAAIERLVDSNEGLTEDLYQAVLVAYQRGATEWARLNYPQWIEAIEAGQQVAPIARTALEGASDDR